MLKKAIKLIKYAKHVTAFTGAGISVESGIPPFRGENGLWNIYDPTFLELDFFYAHQLESWAKIKEIFYDFFGNAKPNPAHDALAKLEQHKLLRAVITQNIDNLHQEAGSKNVYEFHGNSQHVICTQCGLRQPITQLNLDTLPPYCPSCNGLFKPDFIFFGEAIPEKAYRKSIEEANQADVFIVIGSTGEVMPAAMIPQVAKDHGAAIIEINPNHSNFTKHITDIFLQGAASIILQDMLPYLINDST